MLKRTLLGVLLGVLASNVALARTGEEVFNSACVACHASGAPGIPQKGDVAAWAPRIAEGKEALYNSVLNGKNAMPPRGLCMDCNEDEIRAAVDYIISQSGGKSDSK